MRSMSTVNERVFVGLKERRLFKRGSITIREREMAIDRAPAAALKTKWGVHVACTANAPG
jgi:hypothetical protein